MKRLKIGIRPQLIILVCFSSLFSLLILGIVTGVYFSSNLSDLRAERLEVISQLKTTQVKQAVEYVFYQIYWLTTKESIYAPLSSHRAGNNTKSVFTGSTTVLDQFLASSELFSAARLYNLDLDIMAESYNNVSMVSNSTMGDLFPLDIAGTRRQISTSGVDETRYITGPQSNSSDPSSSYFMGITLPVYANTSILLTDPLIAGYLTVIANAKNIQVAINDTNTNDGAGDYTVALIRPANTSSASVPTEFETIFPVNKDGLLPNHNYTIDSAPLVKEALLKTAGSSTNVKSYNGDSVAIGYTQIQLDPQLYWTVIVEQPRSQFLTPVVKLRNIIIGVVIGTGVFMCLITFPLAVWFVRPITKLKEATESITRSKKKKNVNEKGLPDSSSVPPSMHPNSGASSKRNSVISDVTNNSSVYSTAIRLPTKISSSKKFFKDELTELSEAFNIMTEELDKQYTHLEDRVKIRTKELEALKIEAESANEAKTVFIANISHELRTPLNGILGMTAIAMDENDHTRIQESLRLIYRSGELLLHILTELLTYSKNTLNRSKLEKSNFQILEVVYQVQSIFSKLAMDQRVHLNILLKPDIIRKLVLYGDSNRIIQIVMNLVSNSLKFTPVDGSVDVSFKLLGEYDQASSEKEQHKKVHVLRHTRKFADDGPILSKKVDSNYDDRNPDTSDEYKEKHSSNKSSTFSGKDKTFDTNNDSSSILTLSTAEYENTIFNAQFKQNLIPSQRRLSSVSTKSNLQGRTSADQSIHDISGSRMESMNETLISNAFNETSSIGSSRMDGHTRSYTTAISRNITSGLFHQSTGSIGSSFSTNEVIKEDKVYKIKKLYEPKTWAIQIEVTDTGPGIEPTMQDKVFDPFIQGDQTLSRTYGGTGLGLSICRQLAEMMNGTLTLKSTIGSGSTFTFIVPLPQSGEIIVDEEDMFQFCEDEFNPKSKVNRKVAFDIEPESDQFKAANTSDLNSNAVSLIDESGDDSTGNSDYIRDVKDGGEVGQIDNSLNYIEAKSGPDTERKGANDQSLNGNITQLINGVSSGSTTPNPGRKRDLDLAVLTDFEKPHLLTKSSTGTASSQGIERETTPNNFLDELSHLKILVAEDNMVNQEVIRRMLKLEGFTNITMACNGAEAIELVKDTNEESGLFDLILMDVQMPKIDGLLATKRIRNDLQFKNPIIALTAFADETNVKECLNCGMSGFLAKPIRRSNLRKIITELSPALQPECAKA